MTLSLPRFQQSAPLVDENGTPSTAFHVWWDTFARNLEQAFNDLSDQVAAIAAAQAAADAAQATADSKAKVTRANVAPGSPSVNDVWVDTSSAPTVTKTWNGSAWVVAANVGATLGTDVNGTINSGNILGLVSSLAVDTGYIANNAVTNPTSAYSTGSVSVPNTNTWTDVQSAAITATGAPIDIKAFFFAGHSECQNLISFAGAQYRIVRGSTVIFGPVNVATFADSGTGLFYGTGGNFAPITDQPAAGAYTYKIQALLNDLSGTAALTPTYRSINVAELKK